MFNTLLQKARQTRVLCCWALRGGLFLGSGRIPDVCLGQGFCCLTQWSSGDGTGAGLKHGLARHRFLCL